MATASLVQSLFAGLIHPTTGVVLASAKCRFYDPGTLNAQTVYSDGAGATPIVQPLTLTAGGEGIVYTLNPVRLIVKDATDTTTIYDVDPANSTSASGIIVQSATFNNNTAFTLKSAFDAWSTSFGGTAGMWKGKIGTAERNVKDMISGIAISVLDYGAVGDDATNNATAINAALTAVGATGGGTVLLPPGIFRHTTALNVPAGVSLRGSGPGTSILKGTGAANGLVVTGTSTAASVLSDFGMDHSAAATGLTAISVTGTGARFTITNVNTFTTNSYNLALSVTAAATGVFTGSRFIGGAGGGISLNAAASCIFQGCTSNNISIDGLTTDCRWLGHFDSGNVTTAATWSGSRLSFIGSAIAAMTLSGTGTGQNAAPQIHVVGCFAGSALGTVASMSITDNTSGVGNHFTDLHLPYGSKVATSVSVAGGGSTTPDFRTTNHITVRSTSAGTVTINNPTTDIAYGATGVAIRGADIQVNCLNMSGGASTFAFGALYKTTGAVAPASGSATVVCFSLFVDVVGTFFRETSRATTT